MKILFITAPMTTWTFFGEEAKAPYIGYASLGAFLEQQGIKVEVLDCPALELDWKAMEDEVKRRKPDIVGMGGGTCWSHKITEALKRVKRIDPGITTIAGGVHFTAVPEEVLLNDALDFVVVGEGEHAMLDLVRELSKTNPDFHGVKGIAFREDGKLVTTPPQPLIADLDALPLPAYHLFPMEKYNFANGRWKNWTRVVTSRGCPGRCNFCVEWKQYHSTYRTKSGRKVAEELELLYRSHGIKIVEFADDTFHVDRQKMMDFCDAMLEKKTGIHWMMYSRADCIVRDADLLPKMKAAGLFGVLIGVESYTDQSLENMKKGIRMDQIKEAFRLLNKQKIWSSATAIIGWPDETEDTVKRLSAFIRNELNADSAFYQILQPLPGSDLYEELKNTNRIDMSDPSKFDYVHPLMNTRHLSKKDLSRLLNWLYMDFYSKPGVIFTNLFMRGQIAADYMKFILASIPKFKKVLLEEEPSFT